MDINEAIRNRHSVRSYLDKPIPNDTINEIKSEISWNAIKKADCIFSLLQKNRKHSAVSWLITGNSAKKKNYIALIGKKKISRS